MTRLFEKQLVIVPKPPSRFTMEEWYLNNNIRTRTCLDQQQLADKILDEADRVRKLPM